MAFLSGFLRVYSWIFEAILCLMAIVFGIVGYAATGGSIQLGWLPWSGNQLLAWTAALGLIGLLCVLLAVAGRTRILLFLFSFAAFVILLRGLFLGSYVLGSEEQLRHAVYLVAAAFLAFVGAWPMRRRTGRGVNPRVR